MLSFLWRRHPASRARPARPSGCRLVLESLEDRITPYVLSGYVWANHNVSASFMPDGTLISSGYPSNLFATYNAAYPTATWQLQFARALQTWADSSNLNFHFVSDDGSPQSSPGQAQGDSRFGDIRFGGYDLGDGIMGLGWNPSTTIAGGDVELNTHYTLFMGSMPDLYSVVLHESGHGIGFNHSLVDPAVMEGGLWGVYTGIYPDDIAGVQAMYGARTPDAYDAKGSNDTLATATPLTLSYGGISTTADITTMADVDYYRLTVPSGSDGTLTVSVDARNLSLFDPKVSIFDSSGNLVTTASASTYGSVATVNLSGLIAGQTYYVKAEGATADVFGMGAYKLNVQFGGITVPAGPGPDRFESNDTFVTATQFGKLMSLSQTNLTLHTSTDVDYYTFTAGSKSTYTVSITPTSDSGTLALTVYNAQQTVLATGQSSTGGDSLSVTLASGQQYYIKVWSPTGTLFTYNLSIGKSGGGGGGGGGHLVLPGVDKGDKFYRNAADDPDNATTAPPSPVASLSHTQNSDAALATGSKVGALQDGTGSQRSVAGILLDLGQQTPSLLLAARSVQTIAEARLATVPGLQPPDPGVESGGGGAVIGDEQPGEARADRPAPPADPASTPVDAEAVAPVGVELRQQACDACFADGSWRADPADLGLAAPGVAAEGASPAADTATAAAMLAFLLGGYGGAHRAESQPPTRRRFRRR